MVAPTTIKNWDTVNQDGLTWTEWNEMKQKLDPKDVYKVKINGEEFVGNLAQIEGKLMSSGTLAQSGDALDPATNAQVELDTLQTDMDTLMEEIKQLEQEGRLQDMQNKQKDLQAMVKQANVLMNKGAKSFGLKSYQKAAGMPEGDKNAFSGKAQISGGGQTPGNAAAQTYSGGVGSGFTPPSNWGAQTFGGSMPMFNSDTYMKTMAMEDNIMSSWDSVNKNTSRGKQLMMLFFYFARMAESGSMDSMYQFMKFITYIISKDKAKQQIEMGKKLIQLQELSRSWTNKLMNVQTNTTDPAASNELMKTMTIVKSETDAIATSQKLISQMMEEFAQVVETLTNTTKAALETAGRIKRTVSTMR